jgi:hypothetical protein
MLETAAIFIGLAIAKKALERVGEHTGDAFVTSLHKLGDWVREKVMIRPPGRAAVEMIASAPAGDDGEKGRELGRQFLTSVLAEITADDPAATNELQQLITELKQLAPAGMVIDGHVVAGDVTGGSVAGVEAVGLSDGAKVHGSVNIGKAENTVIRGTVIRGGPQTR